MVFVTGSVHGTLRLGFETGDVGTEPGQTARKKALPQAEPVSGILQHRGIHGQWWLCRLEECRTRARG